MIQELALSGPELELLLELLEAEHKELLLEIRHTDTANFRAGLKERRDHVESLIDRTKAAIHTAQTSLARGA